MDLSNSQHDWILISDVDEILNIDNVEIRKSLSSVLQSNDLFIMLRRQRFMFDFDNIDAQQRFTPLINIKLIRSGLAQISSFRHQGNGVPKVDLPYVVEYCFCMSLDAINRKLSTFSHIGTTKDFIEYSMKVNGTLLMPDSDLSEIRWLERIEILDLQVPAYVKQHILTLKTHNVDLNYQEIRAKEFPTIFGK